MTVLRHPGRAEWTPSGLVCSCHSPVRYWAWRLLGLWVYR